MSKFPSVGPKGDRHYRVGVCWLCGITLASTIPEERTMCGDCSDGKLTHHKRATLKLLAGKAFAEKGPRLKELFYPGAGRWLIDNGYARGVGERIVITDYGRGELANSKRGKK